jgi:hypothetical protein
MQKRKTISPRSSFASVVVAFSVFLAGEASALVDSTTFFNLDCVAAPAVSAAGDARLYCDSTSNTIKKSENGGAYADIGGGGGTTVANPTASLGLSAINGVASTAMRSDAAPALSQSITPTWTGLHRFDGNITLLAGTDIRPTSNATNAINIANAAGTDFASFDTTNSEIKVTGTIRTTGRMTSEVDFLSLGGGSQVWKDATPTRAINYGMNVPGQTKTDDLIIAMFNGVGWTERVRVTNGGSFGIGTPNPGALFDVRGGRIFVGTNSFGKAAGQTGDIALDGGTTDTPGILFYYGANNNFGVDVANSTLRFVANMGEGGGTVVGSFNTVGDLQIGSGTTGCLKDADGTVLAGTCVSDFRLKKDFANMRSTLFGVGSIPMQTYRFKDTKSNAVQYGVIAQDVQVHFPELVVTDNKGSLQVNITGLNWYHMKATQELIGMVVDLRKRVETLESR